MPALISAVLGWLAAKIGSKAVLLAVQAIYLALVFAIYAFVITWIASVYNLISTVINTLNTGGGNLSDPIVSKMWGLLNCIGFVEAFNASKPMIFSALTALVLALLYKPTKQAYKSVTTATYQVIAV